jgi:transcriptional regulator with XRE-family HTH domain
MASPQLPNYLVSNRKSLALSQDDVAFLIGTKNGAKVCRLERFARDPNFETALAYEAIFQKPVRELFPGLYRDIEKEVAARAKILAARLEQKKPNWRTNRRRQTLASIAALGNENTLNVS